MKNGITIFGGLKTRKKQERTPSLRLYFESFSEFFNQQLEGKGK